MVFIYILNDMHQFSPHLISLEASVRQASNPEQPDRIPGYLAAIEAQAALLTCTRQQYSVYLCAYQTLTETICDSLIARHWRCACLDNIYRPILAMQRLSRTQTDKARVRKHYRELAYLSHYFL